MKDEKPRAVIYARYSSHNQTEQSIEGQLRDNYAFAEKEGYQVIGEYIDRAQSGTSDCRTDFQRMIKDAESKQFSIIIVWKLDRFARNRYDSATYKARLKKYGVRVVSAMERITDNSEGIILEGMLESMAEYYSANLSENIRRGIRESRIKGTYINGTLPFGYLRGSGSGSSVVVTDPVRAPIIKEVFRRYADGDRMKDIIDDLNAQGVRTSSGGKIAASTFTRAIKNPVYIGKQPDSAKAYPCVFPALIDKETFDRAQAVRESHRHAPAATKAKVRYLLSGKLFCGYCGLSMIGESGTSGTKKTFYYYKCRGAKVFKACHKKPERRDDIEDYVFSETMKYILADGQKEHIADQIIKYLDEDPERSEIDRLERQIAQIAKKSDALIETLAEAPKAIRGQIMAKIEDYGNQRETVEAELVRLKTAMGLRITKPAIVSWLSDFCSGDVNDPDHRQRIIDLLVNSIYLYEDSIIVLYNIGAVQELAIPGESGEIKKAPAEHSPGSDLKPQSGVHGFKSELRSLYGFYGRIYGIHFSRVRIS